MARTSARSEPASEKPAPSAWNAWRLPLLVPLGAVVFLVAEPARRLFREVIGRITSLPEDEENDRFLSWLWTCLAIALMALIVLIELNAVLKGMHLPGRPSAGIEEVGGPVTQWSHVTVVNHAERIVGVWVDHGTAIEAVNEQYGTGLGISAWYVLIDTFAFVPFYAAALALVAYRALARGERAGMRRRLPSTEAYQVTPERLRGTTTWLIALTVVADLAENLLQWVAIDEAWRDEPSVWVLRFLKVATAAKWAGLAAVLVFTIGFLVWARRWGEGLAGRAQALANVRLLLVVLALFGIATLVPEQSWDVPRAWDVPQFVIALLMTATLGLVSWAMARRLWHRAQRDREARPIHLGVLAAVGMGLVLAGLMLRFGIRPPGRWSFWGIAIPGTILVVVAILSLAIAPRRQAVTSPPPERSTDVQGSEADETAKREEAATETLSRALAAAPLLILGLAMVRASAGHLFYAHHIDTLRTSLLLGGGLIALPVAAVLMFVLLRDRRRLGPVLRSLVVAAVLVPTVALSLTLVSDRLGFRVAQVMGAVGFIALFLVGVVLLGTLLLLWLERYEAPSALQLFNMKRLPVLAFVLVWLVLAVALEPAGFHDVRVVGTPGAAPRAGIRLHDAFETWLSKNDLHRLDPEPSLPPARRGRPITPMILVAASGGGIRAAYWTSLVLDCLTEMEPEVGGGGNPCEQPRTTGFTRSARIFAASGISGGSLGLASYAAYLAAKDATGNVGEPWVEEHLDHDFLSPGLGWLLFVEMLRSFLLNEPLTDRAEVMERSMEIPWEDDPGGGLAAPFLTSQRPSEGPGVPPPRAPLLLLNGATVNEGCRFNVSILNEGPADAFRSCLSIRPFEGVESGPTSRGTQQSLVATQDVVDYLCQGQDVRLSTAVLLSARFAFVSPTGRVAVPDQCLPDDRPRPVSYIVDGGYYESSAASPLVELNGPLALELEAFNRSSASCVVPFMVQIDNGYDPPDPPPRDQKPAELVAPLTGKEAARDAQVASAKQAAAALFSESFTSGGALAMAGGWPLSDRYVHIYPRAHPGVQAPLGWLLSDSAIEDLGDQIGSDENDAAVREVRSWDSGGAVCATRFNQLRFAADIFGLPFPLDLRQGWWVTDTEDRLSLFRQRGGVATSITALRGASAEALMAEAREELTADEADFGEATQVQIGDGASGQRMAVDAPEEAAGHSMRGARFEQGPGQTAEVMTVDVPGATLLIFIVRDPGEPAGLESAGVPQVLSRIGEATA